MAPKPRANGRSHLRAVIVSLYLRVAAKAPRSLAPPVRASLCQLALPGAVVAAHRIDHRGSSRHGGDLGWVPQAWSQRLPAVAVMPTGRLLGAGNRDGPLRLTGSRNV